MCSAFQSLNVIENVHLRSIFLMLHTGLCNQDILHHTKIRSRIMEIQELHIHDLKKKMWVRYYITYYFILSFATQDAVGKISFTTDCWSDSNLTPFIAIMAHWSEHYIKNTPHGPQYILGLHSELIAFHCVPCQHIGKHLATVFMNILDCYKVQKVHCDIIL